MQESVHEMKKVRSGPYSVNPEMFLWSLGIRSPETASSLFYHLRVAKVHSDLRAPKF